MNILNLRAIAREGHYDRDIVDALQLYPPSAQRIANRARRDCDDPWDDENLGAWDITEPYFEELQAPRTVRYHLRSAKHTIPLKRMPHAPGSDSPLSDYIGQYYRREFGANLGSNYETWPITLFHALKIPVYRFGRGDETEFHIIRCSDGQAFRNKSPRADWVWCSSSYENAYGALRGKLPVKVLGLYKLRDPERPTLQLALIRATRPENGGRTGDHHGLVRVTDTGEYRIVNIKSIRGAAHLVPESTEAGNKRWFVNSTIDLNTFNEIYD